MIDFIVWSSIGCIVALLARAAAVIVTRAIDSARRRRVHHVNPAEQAVELLRHVGAQVDADAFSAWAEFCRLHRLMAPVSGEMEYRTAADWLRHFARHGGGATIAMSPGSIGPVTVRDWSRDRAQR